jgi:hypothetical protein
MILHPGLNLKLKFTVSIELEVSTGVTSLLAGKLTLKPAAFQVMTSLF